MGPRINTHLALVNNGTRVEVKGPTGDWEPYAVRATFAVVIGQANRTTGEIVLAKGRSDPNDNYGPNGPVWWDADADVFDPSAAGTVLQAGLAEAWGVANIELKNGRHETYAWGMTVRLIDQPPLP
jgi:hypothetical protein